MIDNLGPAKADVVVELGVAVGQFSKALISRYSPAKFYAIDTFKLHEQDVLWGRPSKEVFRNQTHLNFYLSELSTDADRVVALQGDGAEQLSQLDDGSVDVIYVDGSHHYPDVVRDCAAAIKKIKSNGIIVFNDYILWSHREELWYGVVPVVNNLVIERGAEVLGLALHPDMYADIAIRI